MHDPGIRPPVRRLRVEAPEVHVGVQFHAFPAYSIPPEPSPCQQLATNRQWVAPPFFLSGVKMLVCANSNIFTPISGGGGLHLPPSLPRPRQLRLPPPPPVDHP